MTSADQTLYTILGCVAGIVGGIILYLIGEWIFERKEKLRARLKKAERSLSEVTLHLASALGENTALKARLRTAERQNYVNNRLMQGRPTS